MADEVEEIVKKVKEKGKGVGNVSEVVKKITETRLEELSNLQIERYMEEERARLEEAKRKQQPPNQDLSQNFLTHIMQMYQIDPARAGQFLSSLDEDQIRKLAMLSSAQTGGGIESYLPLLKNEGMNVKDVVSIFQMMHQFSGPKEGVDLAGIARIFDAGVKAGGGGESTKDDQYEKFIKPALDEIKELRESLVQERIGIVQREIAELKQRPGFAEEMAMKQHELATFRDMFGGGAKASDEIEKLRIEHDRWKTEQEWDMEKWKMEQGLKRESEKDKWNTIKNLVTPTLKKAGPIIDAAIDKGQETIQKVGVPKATETAIKVAGNIFTCTKCGTQIPVEGFPESVTCPKCATVFAKQA